MIDYQKKYFDLRAMLSKAATSFSESDFSKADTETLMEIERDMTLAAYELVLWGVNFISEYKKTKAYGYFMNPIGRSNNQDLYDNITVHADRFLELTSDRVKQICGAA